MSGSPAPLPGNSEISVDATTANNGNDMGVGAKSASAAPDAEPKSGSPAPLPGNSEISVDAATASNGNDMGVGAKSASAAPDAEPKSGSAVPDAANQEISFDAATTSPKVSTEKDDVKDSQLPTTTSNRQKEARGWAASRFSLLYIILCYTYIYIDVLI